MPSPGLLRDMVLNGPMVSNDPLFLGQEPGPAYTAGNSACFMSSSEPTPPPLLPVIDGGLPLHALLAPGAAPLGLNASTQPLVPDDDDPLQALVAELRNYQHELELQNEVLMAMEDGEILAVVPDIISVIGSDTGQPIPSEGLRMGQRVVVIAHPSPAVWTTDQGLEVVGPEAFGLRVSYSPMKRRASHSRVADS